MLGPQAPVAPPRFSVSMLPLDADPAERDFVRLLERALAPSFTLVRRLGAGAMGSVYLARDPVLKRLVAVKIMAPSISSDPQARARFEREAQTVASISHPNVVSVYSVGTLENGVPYLVMQYVEGNTMAERIAEGGPLDAPTAKRVLGEVASALAAAHRKGVIHRDIKPSNILWDDETGRALVTDFGIAAVKHEGDRAETNKITQTGMAVGTPAYMSPEQVLGEPVTEKTDVYSLGVLGYEMLIGDGPYELSKPGEAMAAHLRDTPRKLSKMRADVDPEVERLLEDCLNKDPERRPSASEAEDRITHGASILLEWPPPGLEHLTSKFHAALRPTALGAGMMGLPLTLLSVFDRGSYVRDLLPPIEYLLAVATVGLFVFMAGCARLAAFFRAAQKAVDTGYHWGTVFEAVADSRGDTGALITGAREYATLAPDKRSRLRRHRVAGAVLLLLAALTPVLGFAAGVLVGARFANGPVIVLYTSVVLALSLLVAWRVLAWYESHVLKAARSRRLALSSVKERPTELAAAWTDSFNQVRAGQPMGPGPMGKRRRLTRTAVTVLSFAVLIAVLSELLIVITGISTVVLGPSVPSYSVSQQRIARLERLRPYVVPADSSISPVRAGQALYAVGRSQSAGPARRWEAAPSITIPAFNPPGGVSPFGDGPTLEAAFRAARRGLSDAERRYLKGVAEHPGLAEFRLAANAPRLDLGSAVYDIPAGSRLHFHEIPIPRFAGIRAAAMANTASAALDLAARQPEDAERRLREVISVGFLLMRDGRSLHENLVGAAIVAGGRQSLEAFYVAMGREGDARAIAAPTDQPAEPAEVRRGQLSLEEAERQMRAIILDTTMVAGIRWQQLFNYALLPCMDLRQLLFGADARHVATLDSARASMVRTASDSTLFSVAEQMLDEPRMVRDGVPLVQPPASFGGRFGGMVTGHRAMSSCAALLGIE